MLGILGVIGLSGLAVGEPPASPLVEGREPNPVAREFHQAETPIGGYVAPLEGPDESSTSAGFAFSTLIWDALLDHLTFPLGTAIMLDPNARGV